MSGLIDVLAPNGLRTGEVLSRPEIHRLGKPHRAIHLYLFNARRELLLQRRSLTVDNYPGGRSISMVGHIDAGEYSAAAVRRELEEELGLDTAGLRIDFLFSHYREATLSETYIDRQFNDVYVTWADVEPASIVFDPAEVAAIEFVTFDAFRAMLADPATGMGEVYGHELPDMEYYLARMLGTEVPAV